MGRCGRCEAAMVQKGQSSKERSGSGISMNYLNESMCL